MYHIALKIFHHSPIHSSLLELCLIHPNVISHIKLNLGMI